MYSLRDVRSYIVQKNPEGLIIDTNVLILFLIGIYDADFIENCNLTNRYTKKDFDLLKSVISYFKKIVITPHIIAELSNLSISHSRSSLRGDKLKSYFMVVVNKLQSMEEKSIDLYSMLGLDINLICELGFTDIGIFELSKKLNMPILTDDTPLHARLERVVPTINFKLLVNNELTNNLKL
jgi:hypothetical protein